MSYNWQTSWLGEWKELAENLKRIPARCLNASCRSYLSTILNADSGFCDMSSFKIRKDWRGTAELMQITYRDIQIYEQEKDRFNTIFSIWQKSENSTLFNFIDMLHKQERYDILEDKMFMSKISKDIDSFLMESMQWIPDSLPSIHTLSLKENPSQCLLSVEDSAHNSLMKLHDGGNSFESYLTTQPENRFHLLRSQSITPVIMANDLSRLNPKQEFSNAELEAIPTWDHYAYDNRNALEPLSRSRSVSDPSGISCGLFPPDGNLNSKVSIMIGDISQIGTESIVNPANSSLLGDKGGADGAIHKAAGTKLREECRLLKGCNAGDAKITSGHNLKARYIIHTVGPRGELPDILRSCYIECLELMKLYKIKSIAFPCISTGLFGYSLEAASRVALGTVRKWLEDNPEYASTIERIVFCVFSQKDLKVYETQMMIYFPVIFRLDT